MGGAGFAPSGLRPDRVAPVRRVHAPRPPLPLGLLTAAQGGAGWNLTLESLRTRRDFAESGWMSPPLGGRLGPGVLPLVAGDPRREGRQPGHSFASGSRTSRVWCPHEGAPEMNRHEAAGPRVPVFVRPCRADTPNRPLRKIPGVRTRLARAPPRTPSKPLPKRQEGPHPRPHLPLQAERRWPEASPRSAGRRVAAHPQYEVKFAASTVGESRASWARKCTWSSRSGV